MAVKAGDFADKAVLITGASRGIGRAAAELFHDLGARVALNSTTESGVAAAIDELGGGERVAAAPGDLATAAGARAVVEAAVSALGGLDVVVNNAGVYRGGAIAECDEPMWDNVIDTNVKGVFFTSQAALPSLMARRGNIVNVGSECSLQGFAGSTVYCASKGAVLNLTRAMALEVAPEVRVNCICPGSVNTDMMYAGADADAHEAAYAEACTRHPLQTVAEPGEVAHAIAYLASDKARFVTGATWQMEGGSTAGRGV